MQAANVGKSMAIDAPYWSHFDIGRKATSVQQTSFKFYTQSDLQPNDVLASRTFANLLSNHFYAKTTASSLFKRAL